MQEILDLLGDKEIVHEYNLENIKKALSILNYNPKTKFIHVAGTNGKGSTCAMIHEILKQKYNVGLYTSPHLLNITERIKINEINISKQKLIELIKKIKQTNVFLTFFELLTTAALLYFEENKLDYAIIETGMGGRLDATNIIDPILCIITNVSIDHTHHLGDSIEKIALEKSGIIKQNKKIITLAQEPALSLIKKITKENNSTLIIPEINNYHINLKGEFQKENAALAIEACKQLNIGEETIKKGLLSVSWPGRFQIINNYILDCAHNYDALKKVLKEIPIETEIIFGIMKDKDILSISKLLKDRKIILVKPNNNRSANPEEIKHLFNNPIIITDIKEALEYTKNKKTLITGSIFTVAESLSFLTT